MIKIALAGNMRSGKDTAADYIRRQYFPTLKVFSFAEPLYDILYMVQRTCRFELEKDRQFLQFLGDWGRQKNSKIWIDMLIDKIKLEPYNIPIIITDARYLNELKEIERQNFVIIKIEADEDIRVARGASNLNHQSEKEIEFFNNYDYIITNNDSFDEFYKQLDSIVVDLYSFN